NRPSLATPSSPSSCSFLVYPTKKKSRHPSSLTACRLHATSRDNHASRTTPPPAALAVASHQRQPHQVSHLLQCSPTAIVLDSRKPIDGEAQPLLQQQAQQQQLLFPEQDIYSQSIAEALQNVESTIHE
ncbi:hypothetical protein Dimus_001042, partial [Dionaea muscipula]